MQLKGKQIKDSSVEQSKLNVTTESITETNSVTNAEYVNTNSVNRVESLTYATLNMNMQANSATIGDIACGTPVLEFPISNIQVKVNNISVTVGAAADCYFSPDGSEIRTGGEAQKGDYLYWNSSRFDLDSEDEIDFIYLVGKESIELVANSTVELDPYYPALNVKYTGDSGTTMTVIIDGVSFIVGNIVGNFVWDIGGVNETVFYTQNYGIVQTINNRDYTIWFDGFGSLLFSIKKGDFDPYYVYNITSINSFGVNTYGQIGMGNKTDYLGAIQTPSFVDSIDISCGNYHSVVLFSGGTIKTFGYNGRGQLGMENETDYLGAIQTPSFTNVKSIYCGNQHTFLLLNDGTVKSFGRNDGGQLGMGTTTDYNGVIQTPSFTNVKKLCEGSLSNSVYVLFNDGTVQSFGFNNRGELGMGNTTNYAGAIQTPSFTNVKDVYCGPSHVIILFKDNTIKSVGYNLQGQLGMGTTTDYNGVVQTPSFTNVAKVAVATDHTVLLLSDGTIRTFGDNTYGQLGMGNTTDYAGAIQTPSFTNVKDVYCGQYHTYVLFNNGTIQSFGDNNKGELGMGNTTDYAGAIQTPSFTDVYKISPGIDFSFIIK